jgi:hypothetical protein
MPGANSRFRVSAIFFTLCMTFAQPARIHTLSLRTSRLYPILNLHT